MFRTINIYYFSSYYIVTVYLVYLSTREYQNDTSIVKSMIESVENVALKNQPRYKKC